MYMYMYGDLKTYNALYLQLYTVHVIHDYTCTIVHVHVCTCTCVTFAC